jgi:hypothetical protein
MSSVTVLIVEKLGNIKEQNIKYDDAELYKKAGHSSATGFKCHAEWSIEDLDGKSYHISVYGKTTGRANSENKYEFPPPIDSTLFFGNCVIVNKKGDKAVSISSDEWDSIYEHLFGGFEDLGDDDSEDEESSEDDGLPRTKEGYVKDGFIVDDDEELDDAFEEEEEEDSDDDFDNDDDDDAPKKKSKKSKKSVKKSVPEPKKKAAEKKTKKTKEEKPIANVFTSITEQDDEDNYLDCTSELSEESYV